MARDISIAFKATDNFTSALTVMRNANAQFKTDLGGLQTKLDTLNRTKLDLKVESDRAKNALKEATKAFTALENEANRTQLEAANEAFENTQRNLKLVTSEIRGTEKAMSSLADGSRRVQNQTGGSSSGLLGALAKAGLTKMVGDTAAQLVSTAVGSAFGSEGSTMFSSLLSGASSGAALGSMGGPVGTVIGAGIGTALGAVNGAAAIFQAQDNAFKTYVQEAYQTVTGEQSSSLTSGSTTAAGRETTKLSFSTLFGGEAAADSYLRDLRQFAAETPFEYDNLTAISKTLKTFGYAVEDMIPTLTKVGDAGAALGLSASDTSLVTTYLGRMKSSDKATLEYLNPLNERGFSVFQWIADDLGTSIADVYEKISKSELSGTYVSDLILNQFESLYGGMMAVQSQTFDGLSATLADAQTELNSFMGAGYNETRKAGLRSEIDFLSGENGLAMQEAYNQIGEWQASLVNLQEQYTRAALNAVMTGAAWETFDPKIQSRLQEMYEDYLSFSNSSAEDAGAKMGALLAEAKVIATNEYNASEGAKLQRESELSLIQSIREDTGLNSEYWDAGYKLGLEFSKGRAAATMNGEWATASISGAWTDDGGNVHGGQSASGWTDDGGNYQAYAYGLPRVPYDNFPAMLHEGERVLTASEARGYGQSGGVNITVTGNSFGGAYSAEEVAREIAVQVLRAAELSIPQ